MVFFSGGKKPRNKVNRTFEPPPAYLSCTGDPSRGKAVIGYTEQTRVSPIHVWVLARRLECLIQQIEIITRLICPKVGRASRKLHDQVVQQKQRVHIARDGCDDVCVMISRSELESLEQALAILADSKHFNEMCESLQKLLHSAGHGFPGTPG